MLAIFLVMLSGAWLTSAGTANACDGWPLCSGGLPATQAGWLAFGHRLLTLFAGILVAVLSILAWRKHYRQPVLLTSATAVGLLFTGQVLISALKVERGYPIDLVGLHAAATAALWAALMVTFTAAIVEPESVHPDIQNHSLSVGAGRLKAFLMLNKPIIVVLLLVTTFAGMVVGGKQIPTFWLAFWTLLGGALAAGGASALNQVIDRVIDGNMQRTAKRPLPSGALTPAEGLAYGVGACLAAFFILAGFVNLLAAVLSLAGMIYYVLLYSVWLKHATVQNIVIGGGAGAIPPLVGWAAATGALNIPSLFLFAIVFMWTPPHFWALAIVRKNDYARVGVPMLPVVKGEKYARIQIFIYTLELVALTLLMPLFKMTGSLFLVSAVVLGLWLIYAAWNVLRKPGNKVAWTMYRYSSMYLAFIFLALVLDVLI
jgi:protoheme IX farnesyltransferase